MADTTTITVRLDAETKRRLDKLAQRQTRTKSWLAGRAIEDYIASQEWWENKIAAADASGDVSEEQEAAFRKKWKA